MEQVLQVTIVRSQYTTLNTLPTVLRLWVTNVGRGEDDDHGVRNLASSQKSGEVWVNELRLLEFNNEGGWAARGQLNLQLSDFGTVDINASHSTDGFGGIEQGVNERQQETKTDVSVTTSLELGKFFPDKAKVSAPFIL